MAMLSEKGAHFFHLIRRTEVQGHVFWSEKASAILSAKVSTMVSSKISAMVSVKASAKVSAMVSGRH